MSSEFDLNNSVRIPESTMLRNARTRVTRSRTFFYFDFYFMATLFYFPKRS